MVYSVSEGRRASGSPSNEVTFSGFVRRWDLKKQQDLDLLRAGGGVAKKKGPSWPLSSGLGDVPSG